ncbi:MAG: hypothetical protein JWM56_371 [Candidatus Peribacteria bacterium]|nr:hypothetical protein [Candidatus Peribacteria bacterium]
MPQTTDSLANIALQSVQTTTKKCPLARQALVTQPDNQSGDFPVWVSILIGAIFCAFIMMYSARSSSAPSGAKKAVTSQEAGR